MAMDAPLAIVRALHFAAVIALYGQLAFVLLVARGGKRPPHFLAISGWSFAIAIASALGWLMLEAHMMSGREMSEALAPEILGTVVTQTLFGKLWCFRIVLLAFVAAALLALRGGDVRGGRLAIAIAFAAALVVVASIAGMGHAAGGRGVDRIARLCADALHLVAAATWLGTLLPLALVLRETMARADVQALEAASDTTRRFSVLGMASVGTLLLTGIVNTSYTLHAPSALYQSGYGLLLTVKIGLFACIVALAAVNRYGLTPRLASPSPAQARAALARLRRNAVMELLAGFAILAIVGQLGVTMPPAPMSHPV